MDILYNLHSHPIPSFLFCALLDPLCHKNNILIKLVNFIYKLKPHCGEFELEFHLLL
jgi:hypothetical protein